MDIKQAMIKVAKDLSTFEKNQKAIAIKTLKMNNPMLGVMGGMSKDSAKKFLKSIGYTDQKIKDIENGKSASEKQAKSLKQRKTDFILNMNTDDMGQKEYAKQKAKVNAMTEDEFDTMFKSMMKRGDL